jgi:hypothetical protein
LPPLLKKTLIFFPGGLRFSVTALAWKGPATSGLATYSLTSSVISAIRHLLDHQDRPCRHAEQFKKAFEKYNIAEYQERLDNLRSEYDLEGFDRTALDVQSQIFQQFQP